jgi:hypothetical protein
MTNLAQGLYYVAADIPGAAGYQDFHNQFPFSRYD